MNGLSIDFSVSKEDGQINIKEDNVSIGEFKQKKNVEKFNDFLKTSLKWENIKGNKICINCYMIANYIEKLNQKIIGGFFTNYSFQLKLINTNQTDSGDIYIINAVYTFHEPESNKEFSYEEKNVLIYSDFEIVNFMRYYMNLEKNKVFINNDKLNNRKKLNENSKKETNIEEEKENKKIDFNLRINEDYKNLATNILNYCVVKYKVKKKNCVVLMIYDVIFGNNNQKIYGDKFPIFLNTSNKLKNSNEKIDQNSYRIAKFIDEFEKSIVNIFNLDYNLYLKLELTNTKKDDNADSIYHIDASYTFYEPLTNKTYSYKDENVFINGINLKIFYLIMNYIDTKINKYLRYEDSNKTYNKKGLDEYIKYGANIQKNYIKEFLDDDEAKIIDNEITKYNEN